MGNLADKVLAALEAKPIARESAKGLYDALDEIAKKLKIEPPTVHLTAEKEHSHPILRSLTKQPNAAAISKKDILISNPILRLFGATDLNKPLNEELKAVLAHEMHHCAHHNKVVASRVIPMAALPAAAIAGVYLYDKAQAKAKEEGNISPENITRHLEGAVHDVHAELPANAAKSPFMSRLLTTGKYIAAAAAGLSAGGLTSRIASRQFEYAADAFASQAVSDKEIMVSALHKVHESIGKSVSEHPKGQSFVDVVKELCSSHPSFAKRAAHIRA